MLNLISYMEERRKIVDAALDRCLPRESERPQILHQAMRYSIFCGGKRLRPILCLECAELFCGSHEPGLLPAVALELLHTYTLIHDDLPAMDNDDLRRGKPTSHKVYGEANAILAGDSLLTLAFEVLACTEGQATCRSGSLVYELARASGSRGVVGGQYEDLSSEGKDPTPGQLEFIHLNKTAALIRAACRMGAIAGGVGDKDLEQIGLFGERIGLAFQAADDLLNATSTAEQLGKAVGSDAERKKMTYVSLYGIDQARQKTEGLLKEAITALHALSKPAPVLEALAAYMVQRKS
ncbi:MAG: farnesyl diphosphate synthase [Lentisphaerota bacterium]